MRSDNKQTPSSSAAKLGGEESGLTSGAKNSELMAQKQSTLDKATSLLDEQTREEKSGFKA